MFLLSNADYKGSYRHFGKYSCLVLEIWFTGCSTTTYLALNTNENSSSWIAVCLSNICWQQTFSHYFHSTSRFHKIQRWFRIKFMDIKGYSLQNFQKTCWGWKFHEIVYFLGRKLKIAFCLWNRIANLYLFSSKLGQLATLY